MNQIKPQTVVELQDGEVMKIVDDGAGGQRVTIEKVETVTSVVYDGSLSTITGDIEKIDEQITELLERRASLVEIKASMEAELGKVSNK